MESNSKIKKEEVKHDLKKIEENDFILEFEDIPRKRSTLRDHFDTT